MQYSGRYQFKWNCNIQFSRTRKRFSQCN